MILTIIVWVYKSQKIIKECLSEFILKQNECFKIVEISNCTSYSFNQVDPTDQTIYCTLCAPGHYIDVSRVNCLPGSINKCDQYLSDSECSKCEDGFYLASPTACIVNDNFGKVQNCLGK